MLEQFLSSIWLQDMQIQIYCALVQCGSAPASTIADQLWRERTSTYKLMKSMTQQWYLTQSMRHGATVFTSIPLETLKRTRDSQYRQQTHIQDHYDVVVREYEQMSSRMTGNTPRISLSQWVGGLRNTLGEMISLVEQHKLIRITCIASMTFDSLWSEHTQILQMLDQFRYSLVQHKVSVDGYYATGMTLMEQLQTHMGQLEQLPTSADAVSLRVVADRVIMIIMQPDPQIITIQSRLYADLFLFVASQLHKN